MATKTYKREVAVALVIVEMAMAVGTMFSHTPELLEARATLVIGLAFPVFANLAAAFGMDWMRKQTTWGGKPEEVLPPASHPLPANPEFAG